MPKEQNQDMQAEISRLWEQARQLETAGDRAGARVLHERIVSQDAGQSASWLRLAAFERADDHYRLARENTLNAARALKSSGVWRNLPYVALRLLELDERDVLRRLIKQASWADTQVIGQAPVLSQHLWLMGEHTEALKLLDVASKQVGPHHLLAYSRANVLRSCGRLDEASHQFEQAIQNKPDYAVAHWSLAYHQKSHPSGARIDRIRRLKADVQPGSMDHVHICYALFKELDDHGDTDLAWAALEEGAAVMRRTIRYDCQVTTRSVERLRQQRTGPLPVRALGRMSLFVVGMPRTGTTLVERILSNHVGVATAGELNDFSAAISLESDHFYSGSLMATDWDWVDRSNFERVGNGYLKRTDRLAGAASWLVDKNPANFFNSAFIANALPKARIVCLLRNPMDACFSNLKELFSGSAYGYSYDQQELADHYKHFIGLARHWHQLMPDRFLPVSYEDLVSHPNQVSEAITRFCGLEFDVLSTDIVRNEIPVSTASSSQVREPIHRRNVEAWKRYERHLAPLQQRLSEHGLV